jgi:hypothetical protein
MMYPLVREPAVEGVPVTVTCRVLKMARQPYYRWLDTPVSDRAWVQAHQLNALVDANRADPGYGYRLLRDEAERVGWSMSRRTAWRLASWQHIRSVISRKQRGSGKVPGSAVADDLVKRDFSPDGPNQLWLVDITEHKTPWIPTIVATFVFYLASSKAVIRSAGVSQSRAFRGRTFSSPVTITRPS